MFFWSIGLMLNYPFAQRECFLWPLAFEGDPKKKRDGEGDKGDGDVHVRDRDVLPDHRPDEKVMMKR